MGHSHSNHHNACACMGVYMEAETETGRMHMFLFQKYSVVLSSSFYMPTGIALRKHTKDKSAVQKAYTSIDCMCGTESRQLTHQHVRHVRQVGSFLSPSLTEGVHGHQNKEARGDKWPHSLIPMCVSSVRTPEGEKGIIIITNSTRKALKTPSLHCF